MSEIMTTRLRTKAFGLFVSINWGCNLLIGVLTLPGDTVYMCDIRIVDEGGDYIILLSGAAIDMLGGTRSDMDDDEVPFAHEWMGGWVGGWRD